MSDSWNFEVYSQFLDLRTRPARDLLSVIPHSFQPKTVYDLGCGPGNSTALLKERWPHAVVVGVDSSPNMLKAAKSTYPDLEFIQDDIALFAPAEKIDCLFANASLQWLDYHENLIPRLLKLISAGGILAIQMPNNFHSASHQTGIWILQNHSSWQPLLKKLRYGLRSGPVYQLPWYYDLLVKAEISHPILWETEYFQEMPDYHHIFDWAKGTYLRPVLCEMDSENAGQFAEAYVKAIAKEYPLQANNKILLPFSRIFIVASKTGNLKSVTG
jgi:trans-aconitate 2-methyltransferase